MNDKEEIAKLYHEMYAAMIDKDEKELNRIHGDDFVLIHMTGLRQDKKTYIQSIMNGTLNYYSEVTDHLDIQINGNAAVMTGQSRVNAAVFGGGRHTWPLALKFHLKKASNGWKLTMAKASTY